MDKSSSRNLSPGLGYTEAYTPVLAPSRFQANITRGGNIDDRFRYFMTSICCLVASRAYSKTQLKLLGLIVALSAVYGGIHLTAWRSHFATYLESVLWRSACFVIVATLPLMICCWVVADSVVQRLSQRNSIIFTKVMSIIGYVILVGYGISRAIVIVESFVSLRSVAIGVYWMPEELQMLLHV